MKRLIRNKRTGKFYTAAGEWTDDVSLALNFISVRAAVEIETKLGLKEVELYMLQMDRPSGYDIVVPLGLPELGRPERSDSGPSAVPPA